MNLTDTEWRVLHLIASDIEECGVQPSYRDIATAFGWRSAGYVTVVMNGLERKGIIERVGSRAVLFNWKSYLKEQSNDAQGTDGSRSLHLPGRNVRRVRNGGGGRVLGSRRRPGRRLAARNPAGHAH